MTGHLELWVLGLLAAVVAWRWWVRGCSVPRAAPWRRGRVSGKQAVPAAQPNLC